MAHSTKMTLRAAFFLLLITIVQTFAYKASPDIPAGLPKESTPQFLLITVDDGLNQLSYDATHKVLGHGHKNPNGSPLPFTYYVQVKYTDFHKVQQRYAEGSEIAVHTMTHNTGVTTDYDTWYAEIIGCRNALSKYAKIPQEDIVGFRAPYLAHSDASFHVLANNGFLYESSVGEVIGKKSKGIDSYIWPYTFEETDAQNYGAGEGPKQPYPNLWEVPMWSFYKADKTITTPMDYPGTHAELIAMFKEAFNARYNGNRAPMGLFFHSSWFEKESNVAALNDFLSWALAQNGVWSVTNRQLIEWMKTPQTIDKMNNFAPLQYTQPSSGTETPDGWDNNGDGTVDEGFVHTCRYPEGNFATVYPDCPAEYPNPVVVPTTPITATVGADTTVIIGKGATPWNRDVTYNTGDTVAHNDHIWACKWYSRNNEPGATAWGPWEDLGSYVTYKLSYNGTITPSGTVRVAKGSDQTFTITPKEGYKIATLLVDGKVVPITNSYPFHTVEKAHSIHVEFAPDGAKTARTPLLGEQAETAPSYNDTFIALDGPCKDVLLWSEHHDWTVYAMGEKRVHKGKVWECSNVAYAIYEPATSWGNFGWREVAPCK